MALSKKILVLAFAVGAFAGSAQAGDYTNSASYNGFGATTQNDVSNASLRDANGNLTLVNGQFTSSTFSTQSGAQSASTAAGVGTSGAGTAFGSASAIGNSLNVVTVGNNNTVVVNSSQTNTGNQNASVDLNGH